MTIVVTCNACHYQFRVDRQHSGKLIRCPDCRAAVTVPSEVAPSGSQPVIRAVRGPGSLSQEIPRLASTSGQQRAVRPASAGKNRGVPIAEKSRYAAPGSPLKVVVIVAVAVFALGALALMAFRLGQRGITTTPDSITTTPESQVTDDRPTTVNSTEPRDKTSDASKQNSENGVPPGAGSAGQDGPTSAAPALPRTPPISDAGMASNLAGATGSIPAAAGPSGNSPIGAVPPLSGVASPGGQPTVSEPTAPPAGSNVELSLADLIEDVDPSIVRVDIVTARGPGHGSGFIVDASGIVVTNYHVVETGSRGSVYFKSGVEVPIDGYLFLDHRTDIAILKIDPSKCPSPLKPVPLADALPRKGESVVAFGAPLGLDFTASDGMVSAIREASDLKDSIGLTDHAGTWIQTTAPISPGNSGGPLVNRHGVVVAINTLTMSIGQNLNFAISAVDIRNAMKKRSTSATPMSPEAAPAHDGVPMDTSGDETLVDAIGTERGQQLLRDIKSVTLIRRAFTYDVLGTVTSAVDQEARNAITKSQLRESMSGNAAMIIVMSLKSAGNGSRLWITSQLVVRDRSGGREQVVMVWEKTGDVGSISDQSLFSGNLPPALKKDISDFFRSMRIDIVNARKAAEKPKDADPDEKN